MATKPAHVAVGDFGTASDHNNEVDWIGYPVQMVAWGSSPIGTPPANSQIQMMAGTTTVTTNASGVATVTLPASFPTNTAWWYGLPTSSSGFTTRPTNSGTNGSQIAFTVFNSSGATVNSTAVIIQWLAMGY